MEKDWGLTPGDKIRRIDLHARYGGRGQGGIGPSAQSPNVFIFTDPTSGEQHGYFDRWGSDGCFYYSGEGQHGDQALVQGNRAILDHREAGRALRVFKGARGTVEYIGEFEIDQGRPYVREDAPETGGGELREVLVFRLRPVGSIAGLLATGLDPGQPASALTVPVESLNTEQYEVPGKTEPTVAERTEQRLVVQYQQYLEAKGQAVARRRYQPTGQTRPLFCDLFDERRQNLIEAKGSVSREAIRMALGQLFDYRRFESRNVRLAVLVPVPPRPDLLELLEINEIAVIWPVADDGFEDNAGGQFT